MTPSLSRRARLGLAAACGLLLACAGSAAPAEKEQVRMNASGDVTGGEVATLGGGCFWCMEAIFERLEGVTGVDSGYSGGNVENPTYEQVCSGETGHAEVVQVHFDPQRLSYEELLEIYFAMHDPTTLNRQGADRGTQYRSVIFWHDEAQRETAEKLIRRLESEKVFDDPIVTMLVPFERFFAAEGYHQDYYANNPSQGYCRVVISPKVNKLREKYTEHLKKDYR